MRYFIQYLTIIFANTNYYFSQYLTVSLSSTKHFHLLILSYGYFDIVLRKKYYHKFTYQIFL